MTERSLVENAATLDAISRGAVANGLVPHVAPGSPMARMVEQAESAAARLPQMGAPTKWRPFEPSSVKVTQST
jgi:hypothetical protein